MGVPQNSAAKGGATPQPIGPLSQNPIITSNPLQPGLQGPQSLSPVSQAMPGVPGPNGQPPAGLLAPQGGGGGLLPGSGGAAQTAGANAQAAMQAAMQGRPVAPTLPTQNGAGLLGSSATAPVGSPQAGAANLGQMIKGMDPSTVANLMKLLA